MQLHIALFAVPLLLDCTLGASNDRRNECNKADLISVRGVAQVQSQASAVYVSPPISHAALLESKRSQSESVMGLESLALEARKSILSRRASSVTFGAGFLLIVLLIGLFVSSRSKSSQPSCNDDPNSPISEQDEHDAVVTNTMHYQISGLTTWDVFTGYPGTVWDNKTLWMMMRRLLGVAFIVALLEFLGAPDPIGLDPSRFDRIGTLLNVFVGLLLSFFLTTNVKRWIDCVNSFISFFNSIRDLQNILQSLGVKQEKMNQCLRYCVLSARIMNYELQRGALPKQARPAAKAKMWEELQKHEGKFSRIKSDEVAELDKIEDASGVIFSWIMSLMGRMSQDGELPEFKSGVYGRVVHYALTAKGGLDKAKATVSVQMPFVYVHTVATIVQVNNLLSAVSLGLTLGATFGITVARLNEYVGVYSNLSPPSRPISEDLQEVLVQVFKCFVAPVLYQAFFEIGVSIATPYTNEDGEIPVLELLDDLERDLVDGTSLVEKAPSWEAPTFKK